MPIPFLIELLIGVALSIIAYAILPKPPAAQPPENTDLEDPTAEAGKPIPLLSGSMTIKGLNIIFFGNKAKITRKVSTGGKK